MWARFGMAVKRPLLSQQSSNLLTVLKRSSALDVTKVGPGHGKALLGPTLPPHLTERVRATVADEDADPRAGHRV